MKDGDILVDSVDVLWGENKETAVGGHGEERRKGRQLAARHLNDVKKDMAGENYFHQKAVWDWERVNERKYKKMNKDDFQGP